MTISKKTIALLSGVALMASSSLFAATVTTDPVGYVTVNIAGGSVGNPTWSFVSVPLQASVASVDASAGQLTGIGVATLTNSNASWTPDVFIGAIPYYVRLTSGDDAGSMFLITDNDATSLTVNNKGVDLTSLNLAIGNTYEIFPGDTLFSAFGDVSDGVVGGTSPTGDVDFVYLLSNGVWSSFYYNTTAGHWRKGNLPISQNNQPISPDSAVVYSRVGAQPLTYVFTGRVPVQDFVTTIPSNGFVSLSGYFPTDQTLGSMALQDLTWWKSAGVDGVTQADADKVYVLESNVWATYHYNASSSRWQKGNLPISQNGKVIAAAGGFLVGRNSGSALDQLSLLLPY